MIAHAPPRYQGLFPVVPAPFTESGELDLASQKRCVDFMIDAGSNGRAILANFSEQFLLADDEREALGAMSGRPDIRPHVNLVAGGLQPPAPESEPA